MCKVMSAFPTPNEELHPGAILLQISSILAQSLYLDPSPILKLYCATGKNHCLSCLHLIAGTVADVMASTKSRKLQLKGSFIHCLLFHILNCTREETL